VKLESGKLPPDLLARMLARLPAGAPDLLVGPGVGEDAAALAFGDRALVVAMDPITFATDLIGWYAVHINANDIAVMGAAPRWFLATLLLPPSAEEADVAGIFDQLTDACRGLDILLIGGHTEVTPDISQPVLVGCMLGEVPRDALLTSAGAHPGDVLILSGPAAIEGTAILGREAPDALRSRGIGDDAIERARRLLFDPGISVVSPARAAAAAGGVTAMHDPTEGGIATGLRELALASGVGLEIAADRIPVWPLTRDICRALDLDPLGLIASGALLIAARPDAAESLIAALKQVSPTVTRIGRALPEGEGLWMLAGGERQALPEFARDEIARFLEGDR
jgi:hydrogenase maturation factor